MSRRKSEKVTHRNLGLLEKMQQIKSEHPFWGYRRVWAYLNYVEGILVNKKRVLRLMREENMLVKANMNLKALRSPQRSKPRPTRPNEWWGIDMTKVLCGSGWVYIVLVMDWHTKKIVGHYAGVQSKSQHWLYALDMAVNRQFPGGAREHGVSLMSDNGCQPTSESFMKACSIIGVKQAFTSYNNPKGNADTERMMRTMKEELFWLREWKSIFDVAEALDKWVKYYNGQYLHSTLGYTPPEVFEKQFNQSHKILLAAA
jgi:putative transposase